MGSAERRARERNQTRELILAAARDIFIKEGFDAVTMRKIAERIEYTPAAIYAHFKDKMDLIMALCDSDFGLLRDAMRAVERINDPVERLRAAGYAYVDFALANPHHYRFMFMSLWPDAAHELDPSRECDIKQGNPDEDAYAFLTMLVGACIKDGRFGAAYRDVDAVTQACWGAAHGVVSLYLTHGTDQWVNFGEPTGVARMLIDAHIQGMLASESPTQRAKSTAAPAPKAKTRALPRAKPSAKARATARSRKEGT